VPLFQEQAMQIAIVGAGFTPEEADRLRRSLATFKKHGNVSDFRTRFLKGMRRTAMTRISPSAAFPRSRASAPTVSPKATPPASRCWSMPPLAEAPPPRHLRLRAAELAAHGLLRARPDRARRPRARGRGAPVCINRSHWDNVMERTETADLALRLGFRQIKSMREEEADWIVAARGNGYTAVEDVWRRAGWRRAR
jgi:hypothetical protein